MQAGADGPVGDVVTAIMEIDSRLKLIHGTAAPDELDAAQVVPTAEAARRVLDGYCTVIYLYVTWFCKSYEAGGKEATDALGEIVNVVVSRLRLMRKNVAAEAIPTMVALLTASALGISPQRWREQYEHDWFREELRAIQAMAVLLAEWINNLQEDPDAALRLVMDAYERAEEEFGPQPPDQ